MFSCTLPRSCVHIPTLFVVLVYILCTDLIKMPHSLDSVKDQKGLKILHLNSRSLINHLDELKVSFLDGSFDVCVFTESWLHSNCTDNLIHAQGYSLFRLDRRVERHSGYVKKGGGIIVYVKEGTDVCTWPNLDVSEGDLECINLSCKQGMHRKVNLTCVYRPPSGRVQPPLDRLESIVESIRLTTSGDSVVVGDFNIDLLVDNLHSRKLKQFAN